MAKHSLTYSAEAEFFPRITPAGPVLIVGSKLNPGRTDRRTLYPDAMGLDMQPGEGVDIVHDLEAPMLRHVAAFAHVECFSVLEHCRRPWLVARNIEFAMQPGGTLYLSVPFVWRWHGYPSDYFRFTADGVRQLFPGIQWERIGYATDRFRPDPFLKVRKDGGHPFIPKCEVVGYGRRV